MNGLTNVAYIDAGSGSYLLAAVAAGASGVWFFARSKWASLRNRGKKNTDEMDDTTALGATAGDDKHPDAMSADATASDATSADATSADATSADATSGD